MKEMEPDRIQDKAYTELCDAVSEAVRKLEQKEDRKAVIDMLTAFNIFTAQVQRMKPVAVLTYYRCTYLVFDYLRRKKQVQKLGRPIDEDVKKLLILMLDALEDTYVTECTD